MKLPAYTELRVTKYFSTDVFVLQNGENALLYAPLMGIKAHVNKSGIALLRRLEQNSDKHLNKDEADFVGKLAELGLTRLARGISLSRPDQTPFSPKCVSLFLTDACNLRCVYCYASAGDAPKSTMLDFEAGAAGIRLVAQLTKQAGQDGFAVSFHGAGEPTLAWNLLVRLSSYAREVAMQESLRVSLTTCTNGVMSVEHAHWLARNTEGATVSLDGDAAIQDAARPCRNGSGSFEQVAQTLDIFKSENFYHSIRATITSQNVCRMADMVEMMTDRFSASHLQFDPVLVSGRCLETGCQAVDPDTFALEFMRACDRARDRGSELGFSILSVESLRTYYCCAVSDGLTVTHDGLVTSCFDVCRPDHPYADRFIYGAYDPISREIRIDREKLEQLRCRNACRLSTCENCFCKYMCSGDCTTNAMRQGYAFMEGGGRCKMTQAIGAYLLARKGEEHCCRAPFRLVAEEKNDFSLANATWSDGHDHEPPTLFGGTRFPVKESYYMRPPPVQEAVRLFIGVGNVAYRLHNYSKALLQYEQARQIDPGSVEAHNNLALTLHKLGRLPEALAEAKAAIALEKQDPALRMTLGKILASCGYLEEALAAFDCVLELQPTRADAQYNRAWVLAEMGGLSEAEAILTDLVATTEPGSDAYVLLQSLRHGREDRPATAPAATRAGAHAWMLALNAQLLAGKFDPVAAADREKMGSILSDCSREQYGKARQALDELLQDHSESPTLRGLSAMLWQAQANPDLANLEMQLAGDIFQEHNEHR